MINQTRAELLKIRSTRTTLGLLLGQIALVLLSSLLNGLLSKGLFLTGKENQFNLLGVGTISGIFAALAGIMLVTSEYRYGTIRPTFLFNPDRSEVFVSKVGAGALAGLIFGVVGEGLALVVGLIVLDARNIPFSLTGGEITQLLIGSFIGAALWAMFGVGLGAIVFNQVGAIIVLLAWGFVVENIIFALAPSVGRYMPIHAENSMVGYVTPHLLGVAPGVAVLVGWIVVICAVGLFLLRQRDVS